MTIATVPYADDMERALIVGLLSDPSLIPRITVSLNESDFFREYHKEIYKVIKSLDINSVDSLTVQEQLSGETKEYFIELVKSSDAILPSLTNIKIYAETIKDKSKLRDGINLGREITAICYEPNVPAREALQKLEAMFSNFLQWQVSDDKVQNTKVAFEEFIAGLGYRQQEVGIQTGFYGIDSLLGNLEGLTVLAARPSLGKTALSIQIMRNIAETRPVAFFSLEQSRDQVFERMLATEAEVNSRDIRSGAYLNDSSTAERVKKATEILDPVMRNMHIDETPAVNSSYISSVARQKKFEWGDLGLIVVDYLNIMQLNGPKKVDALGDAVKELRATGKELNAPVILLAQLNRQADTFTDGEGGRRNRRPELTDLRDSGEIEQSADIVMFLWKEKQYDAFTAPAEDFVEILVRKNRSGAIGMSNLLWTPRFVKFKDV